ncbi:hypothetical protein [Streptomyces sp. NPDC051286]|uniref:hypothetical protein n=1 Tax=Streptomyces sp. NPDC051286 TaxID=3365647 RepID=UPI00378F0B9E
MNRNPTDRPRKPLPLRTLRLLLALVSVLLAAAPAHAGGTCSAPHAGTPIHAGANPWTEIVGCSAPGIPVNGTHQGADEPWRVSRTDNGAQPRHMRAAGVCRDGG